MWNRNRSKEKIVSLTDLLTGGQTDKSNHKLNYCQENYECNQKPTEQKKIK